MKMKEKHFHFKSLNEFVDIAKTADKTSYAMNNEDSVCKWAGGTFEDAVNCAITGNAELVKEFSGNIPNNEDLIAGNSFSRDIEGDFFDVSDYLSGEPECFFKQEYSNSKKSVNIYINVGYDYRYNRDQVIKHGGKIVGIIDSLQKNGYIVNLYCMILAIDYANSKNKIFTSISIDIPTNPIDIDMIAFMIANPLFLRRICLAFFSSYRNNSSSNLRVTNDISNIYIPEDEKAIYFTSEFDSSLNDDYYSTRLNEFMNGNKHITVIY